MDQQESQRRLFAVVKRWEPNRGFGWLNAEDGSVYWCHANSLPYQWRDAEAQAQLVGQSVTFTTSRDQQGRLRASNVFVVHEDDVHLVGEITEKGEPWI